MSRFRFRSRRSKRRENARGGNVPIKAIVPNLVTSMAACAGITSITLSSEGRFQQALYALLSSKLGAELDSLADFVNFGVAPAMFMFFWLTGGPVHEGFSQETVRLVLGCSLFYALCDCFRLARFNTMLEAPAIPYWKHFFTGVPAPGGCWMVLTPAILAIALDAKGKFPLLQDVLQHPALGCFMLLFVGLLMASRLPTISLKAIHFKSRGQLRLFMAVALLTIALLISNVWLTLGIAGLIYLATIPLSAMIFLKTKRRYEAVVEKHRLPLPENMALPPFGVYASRVLVDGQSYIAATNIGAKPTFVDGGAPTIEPHLLDFAGDLYGKRIHVELHKFLRPEMAFESADALRAAIAENIRETREFFAD